MDRALLSVFALMCFYIGYVYLFNRDLAEKWEDSRRKMLNQSQLVRDSKWEARVRFRGASAVVLGLFLLGIVTGVL